MIGILRKKRLKQITKRWIKPNSNQRKLNLLQETDKMIQKRISVMMENGKFIFKIFFSISLNGWKHISMELCLQACW